MKNFLSDFENDTSLILVLFYRHDYDLDRLEVPMVRSFLASSAFIRDDITPLPQWSSCVEGKQKQHEIVLPAEL